MRKEKIIKTAKIIFQVAAGILLAVIAVVFLLSKISGTPRFIFGKTTMWVVTDSMSPTIPARTYILVEEVSAEEVKEGDIIAFYSTDPQIEGMINTHRITHIDGNQIVTKGDGNMVDDGVYSAKAENIVGRYVKTLPIMTFIGRIILSDIGFMVIVFLFLAVIAVCYLPDLKKLSKEKDEQADEEKKKKIDRLIQEEIKKLMVADKEKERDDVEKEK